MVLLTDLSQNHSEKDQKYVKNVWIEREERNEGKFKLKTT